MCSSGAFINFGHTKPPIKAAKVWLNDVPAYAGLAAVDIYVGATEPTFDDPLNKIHPGPLNTGWARHSRSGRRQTRAAESRGLWDGLLP